MAKPKLPIPVTLLTGYLGSGKTTLINHVLGNQEGYKCAVIVNDIGEVNIDAELIQKAGVVTQKDDNLVPLSNGCICCTLKVDLINQIAELVKSGKFDYILIEASGICEPLPIAQSIAVLEGDEEEGTPAICRLDNIVTVVDALRMATEFGCGDNLLKDDVDEEDIESLVIQQIEFCSTIILNKVDMVNEEQLGRVKAMIRTLQPKAKIIEANYGKVSVGDILNTNLYDLKKLRVQQVGHRLTIRTKTRKTSITIMMRMNTNIITTMRTSMSITTTMKTSMSMSITIIMMTKITLTATTSTVTAATITTTVTMTKSTVSVLLCTTAAVRSIRKNYRNL